MLALPQDSSETLETILTFSVTENGGLVTLLAYSKVDCYEKA